MYIITFFSPEGAQRLNHNYTRSSIDPNFACLRLRSVNWTEFWKRKESLEKNVLFFKSWRYFGSKLCNILPDLSRSLAGYKAFRTALSDVDLSAIYIFELR